MVVVLFLLVHFFIYWILDYDLDNPPIFNTKHFNFGYNGYIIPAVGVVIHENYADSEELILHELKHWEQYRREGFCPFLWNYTNSAISKGYDLNPYEVEARYRESEYCQKNYTECVRIGKAKTAFNPNFRK